MGRSQAVGLSLWPEQQLTLKQDFRLLGATGLITKFNVTRAVTNTALKLTSNFSGKSCWNVNICGRLLWVLPRICGDSYCRVWTKCRLVMVASEPLRSLSLHVVMKLRIRARFRDHKHEGFNEVLDHAHPNGIPWGQFPDIWLTFCHEASRNSWVQLPYSSYEGRH